MTSSPIADHAAEDLGPLAWVLDEIHKTLDSVGKLLRRVVREPSAAADPETLRLAVQQLHQTVGALADLHPPAGGRLRGREPLRERAQRNARGDGAGGGRRGVGDLVPAGLGQPDRVPVPPVTELEGGSPELVERARRATGATIASPSVVLWRANPTTSVAPSASDPTA